MEAAKENPNVCVIVSHSELNNELFNLPPHWLANYCWNLTYPDTEFILYAPMTEFILYAPMRKFGGKNLIFLYELQVTSHGGNFEFFHFLKLLYGCLFFLEKKTFATLFSLGHIGFLEWNPFGANYAERVFSQYVKALMDKCKNDATGDAAV